MAHWFGAVSVICTGTGKAPAGAISVTDAPSMVTGPMVPPAGVIV
jgi:hypothetical protein